MLTYSKNTIQSFNPINIYYNFLAIVPIYSFKTHKLYYIGYCFWTVTLSLLISLVCFVGVYKRYAYISSINIPNKNIFFVWEAIMCFVGYFSIFTTIILSSIMKRNYWIELFNNFLAFENRISWINETIEHGAKATFCIFVLKVLLGFVNIIWLSVDPLVICLYRTTMYFYNTTIAILFGDITSIITFKWKVINEILQASRHINNPLLSIRRIRLCRKLIFEMQIVVDLINKIFGNILSFLYGYFWARTVLIAASFYQMIITDSYFGETYNTFSCVALYCLNLLTMVSNRFYFLCVVMIIKYKEKTNFIK